jgi:hypothetical protein
MYCSERRARKLRGSGENQAHESALEFALGFEQFAFDAHAFEYRQVLDKDFAHQMVHFMLDAYGQQTIGFYGDGFALFVQCL